jgi:hypothetical protein
MKDRVDLGLRAFGGAIDQRSLQLDGHTVNAQDLDTGSVWTGVSV